MLPWNPSYCSSAVFILDLPCSLMVSGLQCSRMGPKNVTDYHPCWSDWKLVTAKTRICTEFCIRGDGELHCTPAYILLLRNTPRYTSFLMLSTLDAWHCTFQKSSLPKLKIVRALTYYLKNNCIGPTPPIAYLSQCLHYLRFRREQHQLASFLQHEHNDINTPCEVNEGEIISNFNWKLSVGNAGDSTGRVG
jgi:hypothetical protein